MTFVMSDRSVYLAKYRRISSQRAHFAIFLPNAACDVPDLAQKLTEMPCNGTVIHVTGEPLMSGYRLELKRNYEIDSEFDLEELVALGKIGAEMTFEPVTEETIKESVCRARIEREAALVTPPPRGQNIRQSIDGVTTRRCQEWTVQFVERLIEQGLIHKEASTIIQSHRDLPTHGIFGHKAAG